MRLSVLDLVPVRSDQTTADALTATIDLARRAEVAGYHRYWVAEHHNMPSVGATSPPVLIAALGAATERLRLGSGGVMLPNHAPLAVAEQFALLEALYPGRIDLGLGRAPGSDPVTSYFLRGDNEVTGFPQHVQNVIAMMAAQGVEVQLPRERYTLKATPHAVTEPRVWLLGSSDYSARLAAAEGLPYVFAHHFSGQGTAEALALYRREFKAGDLATEPTTFLTVNAVVAEDEDEAIALAVPNMQQMARLRTGEKLGPVDLVEDAAERSLTEAQEKMVDAGLRRSIVGTPDQAAARLRELAAEFEVTEVMIHPVASVRRGTDPATSDPRARTLELIAEALA